MVQYIIISVLITALHYLVNSASYYERVKNAKNGIKMLHQLRQTTFLITPSCILCSHLRAEGASIYQSGLPLFQAK